ncbi:Type II secretion system protein E [Polystyrenella longa]|uniref:Type II secretion system protein E n=1 Tax=Polystyrenella longa TaxID=2528007 RepID=A0A518CI58_9PLAN|nr:GspE/PulE family protein [Polystyrenella longa]QDU78916.1 Type II secretion system protein E [Polystyrenella longa]
MKSLVPHIKLKSGSISLYAGVITLLGWFLSGTVQAQGSSALLPLPANPESFQRGNGYDEVGSYLSLFCIILILGFFLAWVGSVKWVSKDSGALKVNYPNWNGILLACCAMGLFSFLLIPVPLLGFFGMLLFYAVPMGMYVHERNGRVPASARILTPNHMRKLANRYGSRFGIRFGNKTTSESVMGPPIRFVGSSANNRDENIARARQVENSRGYLAAKELIYDAILRRATDVHMEPKSDEMSIRLRIDGVMYPSEPFDTAQGLALVNIFKVLSAMDITERRRAQDGSFSAELEGRHIDFRVATQGTRYGEKMSLRILDQSNSVNTLKGLGFRKQLLERIEETVTLPHGLMLVCGPTGAGKSTTLYAALNSIDRFQQNIITVEDPIEYKIDNVNQIEINTKSGQTFANSLRSILRQDPDVVMIGEIRDSETGVIACQAANTGHMVFSSVHANDSITALYRMIELGVEPFMISNSISGILAQRLLRRLCPDCKKPYKPKPEILKKLGLPPEKINAFYRPPKPQSEEEICPRCGGLGYFGRIGVFEFLPINDRIRDLLKNKSGMSQIKAEARKNGMLLMREEGLRLVVRGVTSMEELGRVVK